MSTFLTQDSLFGPESGLYNVQLDAFQGPLDLLLHLIKKNEIDIYNIPIATITRHYLDYLELMKELNLDIAGDFLVMASTLVQIKSKMLLPILADEEPSDDNEEDPRAELVRRLIEYQKYKDAAGRLGESEVLGRDVFARKFTAEEILAVIPEEQPLEVELFELIEAFQKILGKAPTGSFHEVGAERISVADRIHAILEIVQGGEMASFEELFEELSTREYIIATFLAVLELCKLRMIRIIQAASFGTIMIMAAVAAGELEGEDNATPA